MIDSNEGNEKNKGLHNNIFVHLQANNLKSFFYTSTKINYSTSVLTKLSSKIKKLLFRENSSVNCIYKNIFVIFLSLYSLLLYLLV